MSQGYPTTGQGALLNFVPVDVVIGMQGIHTTSTTKNHPLGTRCRAQDLGPANMGPAEFIYLQGVASTAAGDAVIYDQVAGTTTRLVGAAPTANAGPVAIAMSANVAGPNFGWYMICGQAVVNTGSAGSETGLPCFYTDTAGQLDSPGENTTDMLGGAVFVSVVGAAANAAAAPSETASLPQGTITCDSTTGFDSAGLIKVTTSAGQQIVRYTGTTGTTFTGCTGGVGVMAVDAVIEQFPGTGFALVQLSYPAYSGGVKPVA